MAKSGPMPQFKEHKLVEGKDGSLYKISACQQFRNFTKNATSRLDGKFTYKHVKNSEKHNLNHKIPNEILHKAYQNCESDEVKRDIAAFAYSDQNIYPGTSAQNKKHGRAEDALKRGMPIAQKKMDGKDFKIHAHYGYKLNKVESCASALRSLMDSEVKPKTMLAVSDALVDSCDYKRAVVKFLTETNTCGNEAGRRTLTAFPPKVVSDLVSMLLEKGCVEEVAKFDKRMFSTQKLKDKIDKARKFEEQLKTRSPEEREEDRKWYGQKQTNKRISKEAKARKETNKICSRRTYARIDKNRAAFKEKTNMDFNDVLKLGHRAHEAKCTAIETQTETINKEIKVKETRRAERNKEERIKTVERYAEIERRQLDEQRMSQQQRSAYQHCGSTSGKTTPPRRNSRNWNYSPPPSSSSASCASRYNEDDWDYFPPPSSSSTSCAPRYNEDNSRCSGCQVEVRGYAGEEGGWRDVFVGSRGGEYYLTGSGNRVYI